MHMDLALQQMNMSMYDTKSGGFEVCFIRAHELKQEDVGSIISQCHVHGLLHFSSKILRHTTRVAQGFRFIHLE